MGSSGELPPRVRIHCADLVDFVRDGTEAYDAICLDIDNGPQWTGVAAERQAPGGPSGLAVRRGEPDVVHIGSPV